MKEGRKERREEGSLKGLNASRVLKQADQKSSVNTLFHNTGLFVSSAGSYFHNYSALECALMREPAALF